MKNRSVLLWCLVTLGVSLSLGYFLPKVTRGKTVEVKPVSSSLNSRTSKSLQVRREKEERLRNEQTRISVEQSEGPERWLHWISAIENASLDGFPQLARVAQGNESLLQLLAQRWFDTDPWNFFYALEEESESFSDDANEVFPQKLLSDLLFEKWVRTDMDSAIEALSSSTKLLGLPRHQMNVFSDVLNLDPRRGLPLLNKWEIRHFRPHTNSVEKWAKENPQEAAAAILDNAAGSGTEECMETVAKVWAKSDPEGALRFAEDAKGSEGAILRRTVFGEWVTADMAAASDWLTEQNDPQLDHEFRPMVVEAWAKEDPQEALAWCQEHLTGKDLSDSITKLVQGAATVDMESAATLVGGLESGRLQQQAARTLAKKWFPAPFGSNSQIPPQAVEWLRSIEDKELKEAILEEVDQTWSEYDAEGYWDFVLEEGNQSLSVSSFNHLVIASIQSDPEGTMAWASGLEGERSLDALSDAFGNWQILQSAQATAYYHKLPQDDARRPVLLESLVQGAASEPEAVASETLGGLSTADRAHARTFVEETSRISGGAKWRLRQILGE